MELLDQGRTKDNYRTAIMRTIRWEKEFWHAFRDNFPASFKELFDVAELPNDEIRVWIDTGGYRGKETFLLNRDGYSELNQRGRTASLKFADGKEYAFPESWFLRSISKKEKRR